MTTTPSKLRTRFNLDRALAATRRALCKLVASLAAQIVAPAPDVILSGAKDLVPTAPLSNRRALAASRRVPPPPLQPSIPSTLQVPDKPRIATSSRDEDYVHRMVAACRRATWNSRNPCPN